MADLKHEVAAELMLEYISLPLYEHNIHSPSPVGH